MSEELIGNLKATISRLEQEKLQLHAENKKWRHKLKSEREGKGETSKELDGLHAQIAKLNQENEQLRQNPDALQVANEALRTEIKTFKHKAAFEKIAKEEKIRGDASIEDLWHFSKYTPESDEPDDNAIRQTVKELVTSRPYLVEGTTQAPPPPPTPGPGFSRGGVNQGDPTWTPEQLADYAWVKANKARLQQQNHNGQR